MTIFVIAVYNTPMCKSGLVSSCCLQYPICAAGGQFQFLMNACLGHLSNNGDY